MGFRFHKSIKLLKGIKLNLSKSGPSLSVGNKGMTFNVGGKGNRATVGLPGTGMSYSSYKSHKKTTGMRLVWIALFIIAALLLRSYLPLQ